MTPADRPRISTEFLAVHKRARILEAMVGLCAEKGYEETTITDLAQRARVARKTLYELFGGKEAVFVAAVEVARDALRERLDAACEGADPDPRECLRAALAAALCFFAEIGDGEASVLGRFTLATPSGVPVALYSEGSADPLWFAGEPERLWYEESIPSWNWLPEGTPTSFSTVGGSTSLALSAEPFGVTIEIDCTESGLSGSVENPSGGGGVATATPTLAGCSTNLSGCTVEASGAELSGTTTTVGPAVEFQPVEGTHIATFTFKGSSCGIKGQFNVRGTLVAGAGETGEFTFSEASELTLLGASATPTGGFVPETESGESLGL